MADDLSGAPRVILDEIRAALDRVAEDEMAALAGAVRRARATFATGRGRSELIARCFAMRLVHVGIPSHAVGDTTTPAIGPGDLLIAVSRTCETPVTLALARQASEAGARVAAVTISGNSSLAGAADLVVLVPDRPREDAPSVQYGGSLFEQTALIVLDALALYLQRTLDQTPDQMDARHANLE
jgi:6-phospho-3-hexuloisomerase